MRLRSAIRRTRVLSFLAVLSGCVVEYPASRDEPVATETSADDDDDGGAAGLDCDEFDVVCDGACVDIERDDEHCGGCFDQCADGTACLEGTCRRRCEDGCQEPFEVCGGTLCECAPGLTPCDGMCVDLDTDPDFCGSCDVACAADVPCGAGECQPDGCIEFEERCGASCTDLANDPLHCGDCFEACDAGMTCAGGECLPYHTLPGQVCGECPCEEVCDPDTSVCCFWEPLDHEICVSGATCP